MKILLARPPAKCHANGMKPSVSLPLGLLYVGAVLERAGHKVEIYDAQVNLNRPLYTERDTNIAYLGDTWREVEAEIEARKPDIIGITNPFTTQVGCAIKLAEIAKRVKKDVTTVIGGNHPTVQPSDFFHRTKAIDMVCLGEGEETFLEIAESYRQNQNLADIMGTAVMDGNQIKTNWRPYIKDLDRLPYPAYHLIDLEDYFLLNKLGFGDFPIYHYPGSEQAISMITSRGCPFNCIFCSIHLHTGRKWRAHSPQYVLGHIEFVVGKYNVKHLHLVDDNLTLNLERFREILDGIIEKKLAITWDTPNGVRADSLTIDMLEKSKRSGCIYLAIAVESGNKRVLTEVIKKRLNLDKVIEVAKWCKKIALDSYAFFIIGFPGEKIKEMKDTLRLALTLYRKYGVQPTLYVATPLVGTMLHKICVEKGHLVKETSPENLATVTEGDGLSGLIETEDFTRKELNLLIQRFRKRFKMIFIYNLLHFLLRNPRSFSKIVKELWTRKNNVKEAILEVVSFKNFWRDKFDYPEK